MLSKIVKNRICCNCNFPIVGMKFRFKKKFLCWNCGNSRNRNDRTKTPYAMPKWIKKYKYGAATISQQRELNLSTWLEF